MRVLIAEDETLIRMDLRSLLEAAGHEVCAEARDGAEAVELATEAAPDLAILDVRMPNLDGIEAARRILAHRPIPLVMLTAYADAEIVERAVDAGVFAYVAKPFQERDILPAIRTAEARHRDLRNAASRGGRRSGGSQPRRRAEVIQAAARIFREVGYAEATIKQVAAEVGVLKGSLYHYVASKEELLYEVIRSARDAADRATDEAVAVEGGAAVRLRALIVHRISAAVTAGDPAALLERDGRFLAETHRRLFRDEQRADLERVAAIIRTGQRSGELRSDLDATIAAGATLALVRAHAGRTGAGDSAADLAVAALNPSARAEPRR